MKKLAIVILLSSQLAVAVSLPAIADEGTSTPIIPTTLETSDTTGGGSDLTFDGVLGTINDSLDTVDEFLEGGSDSISGYLGQVADLVGELFGDTGGQLSGFFQDVAKVINLVNRVANGVGKIGSSWQSFYQSALGGLSEAKSCISSPITINGSNQFINYDPSTWCFGLLAGGESEGEEGELPVESEIIEAPTYPSGIFIPDDSSGEGEGESGGDLSRPKSVPELMALAAQGTVTGIPDLDELREIASEVYLKNTDAFETIEPVRTYNTIELVENSILRKVGTQPLSKAGQQHVAESIQETQRMIVQSSQLAASAQGKKITQDVMKDMTSIQATQSGLLGSIASETATNRFQLAATNVTLSNISRQLAEQQKYERSQKGVLAQQLLFKGFSSDLR